MALPTDGWVLSIDFGTSFTAAAAGGAAGHVEPLGLLGSYQRLMASAVYAQGSGGLLVGAAALNSGGFAPDRLLRCPKRKVGQDRTFLGGEPVATEALVAAVLSEAYRKACELHDGRRPAEVCLTHPVAWHHDKRLDALLGAAQRAGLGEIRLLSEPVAAATCVAAQNRAVGGSRRIGVYDLGGGTFDACVLEVGKDGVHEVLAWGGIDPLGGEDFDDLIMGYVASRLEGQVDFDALGRPGEDADLAAAKAREEIVRAKEALSESASFAMLLGGVRCTLTRDEFTDLIRKPVDATIDEFARVVERAGFGPDGLDGIYLIGGSSRIPVVADQLWRRLGLNGPPTVVADPKLAVALGAAQNMVSPTPGRKTVPAEPGDTRVEGHDGDTVVETDDGTGGHTTKRRHDGGRWSWKRPSRAGSYVSLAVALAAGGVGVALALGGHDAKLSPRPVASARSTAPIPATAPPATPTPPPPPTTSEVRQALAALTKAFKTNAAGALRGVDTPLTPHDAKRLPLEHAEITTNQAGAVALARYRGTAQPPGLARFTFLQSADGTLKLNALRAWDDADITWEGGNDPFPGVEIVYVTDTKGRRITDPVTRRVKRDGQRLYAPRNVYGRRAVNGTKVVLHVKYVADTGTVDRFSIHYKLGE